MATSILHRMTGMALGAGLLLLAAWLVATAMGAQAYGFMETWLGHPVGRTILFGFTLALVFHLLNGIRHLVWDAGKGFEVRRAHRAGVIVMVAAVLLTLAVWAFAYWLKGAF